MSTISTDIGTTQIKYQYVTVIQIFRDKQYTIMLKPLQEGCKWFYLCHERDRGQDSVSLRANVIFHHDGKVFILGGINDNVAFLNLFKVLIFLGDGIYISIVLPVK